MFNENFEPLGGGWPHVMKKEKLFTHIGNIHAALTPRPLDRLYYSVIKAQREKKSVGLSVIG